MLTLGIDTSNYATSLAVFDANRRRGLFVTANSFCRCAPGSWACARGDALFHHTAALPELLEKIGAGADLTRVGAVGVSARPRPVEGSYMPCFLAGLSAAAAFSARARRAACAHDPPAGAYCGCAVCRRRGGPFRPGGARFSCFGRHDRPVALRCSREPPLPWHLTGPLRRAGVDRLGVRLGFAFPAGAKVSELAAACPEDIKPRVSVKGMNCSLSGLQNQYEQLLQQGCAPEYVCKYCLLCVAERCAGWPPRRSGSIRACRSSLRAAL